MQANGEDFFAKKRQGAAEPQPHPNLGLISHKKAQKMSGLPPKDFRAPIGASSASLAVEFLCLLAAMKFLVVWEDFAAQQCKEEPEATADTCVAPIGARETPVATRHNFCASLWPFCLGIFFCGSR